MVMEVLLSAVEGREPVSLLRIALTLALQESGPTKGHGADETDSPIGNPPPGRDRAEGEGEIAESAIRLAIVAQLAQPLPWGTSIGGRSWMAK